MFSWYHSSMTNTNLFVGTESSLLAKKKEIESGFLPIDRFSLISNETIKVEQVLSFIETVLLAPVGKQKVMFIFDMANMTHAAQNKLLKTLEESSENTIFVLLTTNIDRALNTVKSRCVTTYLSNTEKQVISTDVKKLLACKTIDEALPLISKLGNKDNVMETVKKLSTQQLGHDILTTLATINRNIQANCNATNAFDLFIMEYFKS